MLTQTQTEILMLKHLQIESYIKIFIKNGKTNTNFMSVNVEKLIFQS